MTVQPAQINVEIQKLEPSAIIELFVLDGTSIGAEDILYFHAGTNGLLTAIVWQGQTYNPFPIKVDGFEVTSGGQLPRPKLQISNLAPTGGGITGLVSFLALQYGDFRGAKIIRKRTLAKYLDAVNFPGSVNPSADDTASFLDDIYFVDQKESENRDFVQFALAVPIDVNGVQLPRRQIVQNICPWKYRGAECGYTGTVYFTEADVSTIDVTKDVCGKRLKSCKLRFTNNLPYGGFPAAGLIKQ